MSSPIVNFALRGAQAVFAAVVLGLSVTLAKGHHWGNLPITLGYASFVGAASLLAAFIGIIATWVDLLQGVIGLGIDAFVLLLNLAGGILIAIKMKGGSCTSKSDENYSKLRFIDIINGGCRKESKAPDGKICYYEAYEDTNGFFSRCKSAEADSAFMFLTLVVLLAAVTLTWLHQKRR